MISINAVDHHDSEMAAAIYAVQMAAYAQEGHLLGVRHFPPLERTIHDIQVSSELYFAAFADKTLVGVISIGLDKDGKARNITSLVVHPARQREGIASLLLKTMLEKYGADSMTVQTAVRNLPALALYTKFGFIECKRWSVGKEGLELVRLHRPGPSNK